MHPVDSLIIRIAVAEWNQYFVQACVKRMPELSDNKPEHARDKELYASLTKRGLNPIAAAREYLATKHGWAPSDEGDAELPTEDMLLATYEIWETFFLGGVVKKAPQMGGYDFDAEFAKSLFDEGLDVPAAVDKFLETRIPGWETGAVPEGFKRTPSLASLFASDQLANTRPGCICGMCAPDETGSVPSQGNPISDSVGGGLGALLAAFLAGNARVEVITPRRT